MKTFKPIRVLVDQNLEPKQVKFGIETIGYFLNLVGATNLVRVDERDSVDLEFFHVKEEGLSHFLEEYAVVSYLVTKDLGSHEKYIHFLFTQDTIYSKTKTEEVYRSGIADFNTLGVAAFGHEQTDLNKALAFATIIHELGHIYGVPVKDREDKEAIELLNGHCPNDCVMYPDSSLADKIDLINKPFCDQCLADLRKHFEL